MNKLGLLTDLGEKGGIRSLCYTMIIRDGIVSHLNVLGPMDDPRDAAAIVCQQLVQIRDQNEEEFREGDEEIMDADYEREIKNNARIVAYRAEFSECIKAWIQAAKKKRMLRERSLFSRELWGRKKLRMRRNTKLAL